MKHARREEDENTASDRRGRSARGAVEPEASALLNIRRIYVDKLSGNESAAQIRDMIINTLQSSKLFVITEDLQRADAVLKGSADDAVFTDNFQSNESMNARLSLGGV